MPLNRSMLSVAAIMAALACVAASPAQAQQKAPPQAPAQKPEVVSDKEIETFAAAATDVRQLNKQWAPKVEAASKESPEAGEAMRRQALEEMAQAVERKGLSVDRYQEIFQAAQADPEVRQKIIERMPKGDD
jgi:hypothetical protein